MRRVPQVSAFFATALASIVVALAVSCSSSNSSSSGTNPTPGGTGGTCGGNGCQNGQTCVPSFGCTQCSADGDCPAAEHHCISGRCVGCASNADCSGATPVCYPLDHTCHATCTATTC